MSKVKYVIKKIRSCFSKQSRGVVPDKAIQFPNFLQTKLVYGIALFYADICDPITAKFECLHFVLILIIVKFFPKKIQINSQLYIVLGRSDG